MSKYAVGGIDMQRCFMPLEEGQRLHMDGFGELPVDGGEETVIAVNALLNTATINGHDSFITLEAHPEDQTMLIPGQSTAAKALLVHYYTLTSC
jgi:nicotinamidase-related amidase